MSSFVLLEICSVCVRFSFNRNGFSLCQVYFYYKLIQCVSGLVLLEICSVSVRYRFTRNGISVCQV